ncbi:radical SAM protein [Micromonospora sp. KC606]|uniref:radical SAM protein n=1 Tax=Micromonospora sp. KC606 TaxID=2530379 RepID=UPI00104BFD10|nr:radical SAM protein [Micromonospora sp. KC606]TDC85046.1 radical SAM protein [Micromonospora sp. KC606]
MTSAPAPLPLGPTTQRQAPPRFSARPAGEATLTRQPAPPPGTEVRLLRGRDSWWAVHGNRVARLPLAAVHGEGPAPTLTPQARAALAEGRFFASPNADTYAVTVLTATACNLGCSYCFQNTALPPPGSSAPPRIRAATLTSDLIARTTAFVQRQMSRFGQGQASLLLFGGEPLLNPVGAVRILRALQPLNLVDADIVTNGVLLTPRLAGQLTAAGLRRMQITFDGARPDHDRIRVTRDGRATYDKILRNVADAVRRTDLSWTFRVNVSHRNIGDLDRLIEDLASVTVPGRTSLHLSLVDDVGLGYDNAVGYTPGLADRFIALHARAIEYGMTIPVSKPLTACPYCSTFGGDGGAVINADGHLYSCWETAGREGWSVGDVTDGYLPAETIRSRWVPCDYDILPHGSDEQAREFFDRVDATALDGMYAAGRLAAPAPGRAPAVEPRSAHRP